MIICQNNVYHLFTETYSCLLRVNPWGLVEQLHFGAPVCTEDAESFACRPGLGWGASVILDEKETASCPDVMALAWSGSGRGDYRESPLELGGVSTDFRFAGAQILEGCPAMDCGLPQAHGAQETLELTLEQKGARLKLYFTPYPTALVRRTVLENTGDGAITVNKLMSASLDLTGDYCMATFNGGWIA